MVARSRLHERVATWGAITAMALAVAGVVFSAGDARQMQVADHSRLGALETHDAATQRDMTDVRVSLAVLAAQMQDVQVTVHRVDGSPVPISDSVGRANRR